MTIQFEVPNSSDALYVHRGNDIPLTRPVFQGDVFAGYKIPGIDEGPEGDDALIMLIAHPCSMRAGPALRQRLQAVRVGPYELLTDSAWRSGHLRVMPLPDLRASSTGATHFAALFEDIGVVASADLELSQRIAVLSDLGVRILQQRLIVYFTRYAAVDLATLDEASRPAMDEVDLLEEWNEVLCADLTGEQLVARLAEEAAEFDAFIHNPDSDGLTVQQMLREPQNRAAARRRVRTEIARRAESQE